jgi:hypothetical protein
MHVVCWEYCGASEVITSEALFLRCGASDVIQVEIHDENKCLLHTNNVVCWEYTTLYYMWSLRRDHVEIVDENKWLLVPTYM